MSNSEVGVDYVNEEKHVDQSVSIYILRETEYITNDNNYNNYIQP